MSSVVAVVDPASIVAAAGSSPAGWSATLAVLPLGALLSWRSDRARSDRRFRDPAGSHVCECCNLLPRGARGLLSIRISCFLQLGGEVSKVQVDRLSDPEEVGPDPDFLASGLARVRMMLASRCASSASGWRDRSAPS